MISIYYLFQYWGLSQFLVCLYSAMSNTLGPHGLTHQSPGVHGISQVQ